MTVGVWFCPFVKLYICELFGGQLNGPLGDVLWNPHSFVGEPPFESAIIACNCPSSPPRQEMLDPVKITSGKDGSVSVIYWLQVLTTVELSETSSR